MNKLYPYLCAMLLLLCAGYAQADSTDYFGFRLGMGKADLEGDEVTSEPIDVKSAGVVLSTLPLSGAGNQLELYLVEKGASGTGTDAQELNLVYAELCGFSSLRTGIGANSSAYIFGGGAVSALVSAKVGDEDVSDELRSYDFSLVFGVGLDFATSKNARLAFDLRYTGGTLNISKASDDIEATNSNVMFSVTLLFNS